MDCIVTPGSPLEGKIQIPGDKSLSHRAALFASLAMGTSRIENFLMAGVTQAMLDCLQAIGIDWSLEGEVLTVHGKGFQGFHAVSHPLNCRNSATTLRLLAGGLTATGTAAILDGSEGLRRRPMERIVTPLQRMGALINSTQGCAPLVLSQRDRPLISVEYSLPVASAQVKSCLILAGLAADGSSIFLEPQLSRDHTERMLSSMGAHITRGTSNNQGMRAYFTRVEPLSRELTPLNAKLPGDFSAAAFLIVASLVTNNSSLFVEGVGINPTRTGLLDTLVEMGGRIEVDHQAVQGGEPVATLSIQSSELRNTTIDGDRVVWMIDEFPIFAVAAALGHGKTTVWQAGELRHKESDRIGVLCQELQKLGVDIQETADGFIINGQGKVQGGLVDAHSDHRLGMALVVAGLAAQAPVTVQGAEIIHESFPGFIPLLQSLGAKIVMKDFEYWTAFH